MTYHEILTEVAASSNMTKGLVDKIYRAFWRAVREHIESLPLKQDLSEDEFNRIQPNVNIPSLGKFHVSYSRWRYLRNDYKKYLELNKENKEE